MGPERLHSSRCLNTLTVNQSLSIVPLEVSPLPPPCDACVRAGGQDLGDKVCANEDFTGSAAMVMVERICAWCKTLMGTIEGDFDPSCLVTHGICEACEPALSQAGDSIPAQDFLEQLNIPVLLVDTDGRALAANRRARAALGKDFPPLDGFKGGSVLGCANSKAGNLCGGTAFCRSRVILRAVAETYETGRACVGVPTYPDARSALGIETPSLNISTEKVGACVMLRIDEAGVAE